MDGALLIRLEPLEDPEGLAEIRTSIGVLRGPDCQVTISHAHETGAVGLDNKAALQEA